MTAIAAPALIPFDLSRSLAGAPLRTRDGHPVTGFHRARPDSARYPFEAKVDGKLHCYTREGTMWVGRPDALDLVMEAACGK